MDLHDRPQGAAMIVSVENFAKFLRGYVSLSSMVLEPPSDPEDIFESKARKPPTTDKDYWKKKERDLEISARVIKMRCKDTQLPPRLQRNRFEEITFATQFFFALARGVERHKPLLAFAFFEEIGNLKTSDWAHKDLPELLEKRWKRLEEGQFSLHTDRNLSKLAPWSLGFDAWMDALFKAQNHRIAAKSIR